MRSVGTSLLAWASVFCVAGTLKADILELTDGTVLKDCYVRDEGVRVTVWTSLAEVGKPPRIYPKSQVKDWTMQRGADWDRQPDLPDLTVTYIEINPKLAGLHGRVQYDEYGRPWIAGPSSKLVDMGERKFIDPEGAVRHLKLRYEPGETLHLTAHIKNVGFRAAEPFEIQWFFDGQPVARGSERYGQKLAPMEEAAFDTTWQWQEGFHTVTVKIITEQPEIAVINNEATDPLWAWAFNYIVAKGRVAAWHEFRSAYGTFCFEDFYRWHLDIMNLLLEHSIWPAAPQGIRARVRLDRIIYADSVKDHDPFFEGVRHSRFAEDGIRYDQGAWGWDDSEEELKTGKWQQTDHNWRNSTEWSLPHELGHQLGLVDWYALDYPGCDHHLWPDNGEKVTHFQRCPFQMMHWHGPQLYGEADAAYLNMTIDKPRGYFGDYYFAIPRENFLVVRDINGRPVADAQIEVFQRGCVVDTKSPGGVDHGVRYFDVVEDGDFYTPPVSKDPVIVGQTDAEGRMRLPNRPTKEVRTLNGFHRRDNPFGNMNVVGPRNLMLVKVSKHGRVFYYWLEGHDFVVAWFRGQKERFEMVLKTPLGSLDSPLPPRDVQVVRMDDDHVKVTWSAPAVKNERSYLERVIGYKVYRRVGNDGLDDRPWFPVATLGPEAREFAVDLTQYPADVYWYQPRTERFGVTSLSGGSVESELVETLLR